LPHGLRTKLPAIDKVTEEDTMAKRRFHDSDSGFEIDLPAGWRIPSLFSRVTSNGNPEFYGSDGSALKFAVGPIDPLLCAKQQKVNLQTIAAKYGHKVLSVDEIEIGGKTHATMVCTIPQLGTLKNYSLIFKETEYLITARGDFDVCDSIVRTFRAPDAE